MAPEKELVRPDGPEELEPQATPDQTEQARRAMAEKLDQEPHRELPPDFVAYGEAPQLIDRDEIWVH